MVVAEAAGSRIRDLSGNEYIDYLMGSGPSCSVTPNPEITAGAVSSA